jgi:hypothetical protein
MVSCPFARKKAKGWCTGLVVNVNTQLVAHITGVKEAFYMAAKDSTVDFWSLSSSQLAERVGLIASADPSVIDDATRTEASQLVSEWKEALDMPNETFPDQERKVAQLDALQMRTIEILVSVNPSA